MPRVKRAIIKRRRKKKIFQQTKGFFGGRRTQLKQAQITLLRGGAFAHKHRRLKKRDFRALWIVRISAACEMRGYSYSRLIDGLNKAGVKLNRKQLSEIAIHDPVAFDKLVEEAKNARQAAAVA